MKKQQGVGLIEIVMMIVIIGIVSVGSLMAFNTIMTKSNQPGQILGASQLANARMNLVIQQYLVNGFASIGDPCGGNPPACTGLAAFASSNGFVVNVNPGSPVSGVQTATVTVSGAGSSQVMVRFVE